MPGANDTDIVNAIARHLRNEPDWNADTIEMVAALIAEVRTHPGNEIVTEEYEPENPGEPTPYDQGTALEPRSWIPYGTAVNETTPAANFGKVDFNDDEGHTVLVARTARDVENEHTVLYIQPQCEKGELAVVIEDDEDDKDGVKVY